MNTCRTAIANVKELAFTGGSAAQLVAVALVMLAVGIVLIRRTTPRRACTIAVVTAGLALGVFALPTAGASERVAARPTLSEAPACTDETSAPPTLDVSANDIVETVTTTPVAAPIPSVPTTPASSTTPPSPTTLAPVATLVLVATDGSIAPTTVALPSTTTTTSTAPTTPTTIEPTPTSTTTTIAPTTTTAASTTTTSTTTTTTSTTTTTIPASISGNYWKFGSMLTVLDPPGSYPSEPALPTETDDSGPVVAVVIALRQAGPDGIYGTGDDIVLTTTTDSNGDYEFTNLQAGSYQITAAPPGASREFFGWWDWPGAGASFTVTDWFWDTPVIGVIDANLAIGQHLTDQDFVVRNTVSVLINNS